MDQPTPQSNAQDDAVPKNEQSLADEYLAGWKRATADYANLKKETDRLREDFSKYAAMSVIIKMLPVYENLCKAAGHIPSESTEIAIWKQWAQGVTLTTAQFENILTQIGVQKIDQLGPFDPMLHEAVMSESKEGVESGQVVKILELGYRLHDRILRPAKVVVTK